MPDPERETSPKSADAAARIRELESRLASARRMEVLGRLVGGVAHDFNNVLSVITTLSELLIRFAPDDDPDLEDLEEIRAAALRGSELTRQLLAFARADVGEPVAVDLNERVRLAEKLFRKLLPEDVTLTVDVADDVPRVRADPVEVDQVILNLAAHGRECLREGGTIRLSTTTGPEGEAVIGVLLEGRAGAPVDMRPDTPASARGAVVEPGLRPIEEMLLLRGGELRGENRTISVLLQPAEEPAGGEEAVVAGNGEEILVVEDQATVAEGVVRTLEALGYNARAAGTGEEALAAMRERDALSLVVCDVVLEDCWGAELERRWAASDGAGIPFVFFSGHEQHPALAELRAAGRPVLRKPFTQQILAAAVADALRGTRDEG